MSARGDIYCKAATCMFDPVVAGVHDAVLTGLYMFAASGLRCSLDGEA